jgi:methionyl-tRNA formyltransferase
MDLVFCGTPQFAVLTLEELAGSAFSLRLVITQPDRPRGRGQKPAPSPVKRRAQELGLPVVEPETIKSNDQLRAQLESLRPAAIVIVGYGRIVPPWMLALAPLGNINLHASLLPKYRGAAPIQWAIANGESMTGVTTMRINQGLDTGDILLQKEIAIALDDTALTLAPRLAAIGAELMVDTLRGLVAGSITPRPQDHSRATLAPLLKREDGRMDFTRPAQELANRLRGFQPWPGAFTTLHGKQLAVTAAAPVTAPVASDASALAPGTLAVEGARLLAGCGGATVLELLELQPEGRKRMPARDFLHGYHPRSGERLGE